MGAGRGVGKSRCSIDCPHVRQYQLGGSKRRLGRGGGVGGRECPQLPLDLLFACRFFPGHRAVCGEGSTQGSDVVVDHTLAMDTFKSSVFAKPMILISGDLRQRILCRRLPASAGPLGSLGL